MSRRQDCGAIDHDFSSNTGNYASHVGRIGALAVALGIGTAIASGYGVAAADPGPPTPTHGNEHSGKGPNHGANPVKKKRTAQRHRARISEPSRDNRRDESEHHPLTKDTKRTIGRARERLSEASTIPRDIAQSIRDSATVSLPGSDVEGTLLRPTKRFNIFGPAGTSGSSSKRNGRSPESGRSTFGPSSQAEKPDATTVVEAGNTALSTKAPRIGRRAQTTIQQLAQSINRPTTGVTALVSTTDEVAVTATITRTSGPTKPPAQPIRDALRTILGVFGYHPDASNPGGGQPRSGDLLAAVWAGYRRLEAVLGNDTPTTTTAATTPTATIGQDGQTVTGNLGVTYHDTNGDVLSYTATSDNGTIEVHTDGTYTAALTDPDKAANITVTVSDAESGFHFHGLAGLFGGGHDVATSYQIVVTPATTPGENQPPQVIGSGYTVANVDHMYGTVTGTTTVRDPEGRPLTYRVLQGNQQSQSAGTVVIDPNTGNWAFTPTNTRRQSATPGDTVTFVVVATDSEGAATHVVVTSAVDPRNPSSTAPVIAPTGAAVVDGQSGVAYQLGNSSDGNQVVTVFSPSGTHVVNLPQNSSLTGTLVVNPATGTAYQTTQGTDSTGHPTYSLTVIDSAGHTTTSSLASAPTNITFDGNGLAYITSTAHIGEPDNTTTSRTLTRASVILASARTESAAPTGEVSHVTVYRPDGSSRTSVAIPGVSTGIVFGSDGTAYLASSVESGPDAGTYVSVINNDASVARQDQLVGAYSGKIQTTPTGGVYLVTAENHDTVNYHQFSALHLYALGPDGVLGHVEANGRQSDTQLDLPPLVPLIGPNGTAYVTTSSDDYGSTYVAEMSANGTGATMNLNGLASAVPHVVVSGNNVYQVTSAYDYQQLTYVSYVYRITPDGQVPTPSVLPDFATQVVAGPGGSLYVTNVNTSYTELTLTKVQADGTVVSTVIKDTSGDPVAGIPQSPVAGGDGNTYVYIASPFNQSERQIVVIGTALMTTEVLPHANENSSVSVGMPTSANGTVYVPYNHITDETVAPGLLIIAPDGTRTEAEFSADAEGEALYASATPSGDLYVSVYQSGALTTYVLPHGEHTFFAL